MSASALLLSEDVPGEYEDVLGEDPRTVARALPLIGGEAIGEPFPCPLHRESRVGVVGLADLRYRCSCVGTFSATVADVYAMRRALRLIGKHRGPTSNLERAVWWNRLWTDSGVLDFDLPEVTISTTRSGTPAALLQGFVLLQAIRNQRPALRGLPVEYAEEFAAVWCGLPKTTVGRGIRWLVDHDVLLREDVSDPQRPRLKYRYRATGRGLALLPQHADLIALTPET